MSRWEMGVEPIPVGGIVGTQEWVPQQWHTGIMVSGVPVGEEGFVEAVMRNKSAGAVERIRVTTDRLHGVSKHALLTLITHCLQPLMDYLCMTVYPTQSQPHLRRFDAAVLDAVTVAMCPGVGTDEYARRRLRLPVRWRGRGS